MSIEIENDEIINNIDIYEGNEGYAFKGTFDQETFNKISKLELNLKSPNENTFNKLKSVFSRKKIVIHEYHEIESAVDINSMQGNIKLNLITRKIINQALSKIKNEEKRKKIQYVYLAGVQILVKSLFKEGIDSPIVLSLHDQRFRDANKSHLGTIEGNLYYQKLLFTCYPKYCISIKDKNLDEALSLHFKLLKDISMKSGNKVLTLYYTALYSFSNSNYGNIYQNKPYIEINEECNEIARAIEPLSEEPSIPEDYKFHIVDKNNLIDEGTSDQSFVKFNNNQLIRMNSSRRNSFRIDNRLETNLGKQISERNQGTLIINGIYFNGKDYIEGPNILIDTGASNNHLALNKNFGLKANKCDPYLYQTLENKVIKCEKEVDVSINLEGRKITIPCFIDNAMSGKLYHIILGNSFLKQLDFYSIEKEGIYIKHKGEEFFCAEIKR